MSGDPKIRTDHSVELPDELWSKLLDALPGALRGIKTSIRLFSGEIYEDIIISNRGRLIGREAEGMAGLHGAIDSSMLQFGPDDIEAVLVPSFSFFQKPKWIAFHPENPARDRWLKQNPDASVRR